MRLRYLINLRLRFSLKRLAAGEDDYRANVATFRIRGGGEGEEGTGEREANGTQTSVRSSPRPRDAPMHVQFSPEDYAEDEIQNELVGC